MGALVGLVHCPVQLGLLGAFVVCKLAYNAQHAKLQDATLPHTHRVCAVRLAWFDVWHARCNVHRTPAACSVQLCDARLSLVSYLLNNTVDSCMRARVRGLLTLTSVKYCETCTIARLACVFVFYPMAWLVFLAADARLRKLLREVHRGVRLARLARPRLSRGACRSTGSVARVGARNASVPVGGGVVSVFDESSLQVFQLDDDGVLEDFPAHHRVDNDAHPALHIRRQFDGRGACRTAWQPSDGPCSASTLLHLCISNKHIAMALTGPSLPGVGRVVLAEAHRRADAAVCNRAVLPRRDAEGRHTASRLARRGCRAWHANREGDHQQSRIPSLRKDPQPGSGQHRGSHVVYNARSFLTVTMPCAPDLKHELSGCVLLTASGECTPTCQARTEASCGARGHLRTRPSVGPGACADSGSSGLLLQL